MPPTPQEIEQLLINNGINPDDVASTLKQEMEAGRIDAEGARAELNKLYDYYSSKNTAQGQKPQTKTNSPGYVQGMSRDYATAATAGAAPYIAGATNVVARRAGNVLAGVLDRNPRMVISGLFPTTAESQGYYEEGKREYRESQKAFAKEHPVASAASKLAGAATGIALSAPAGAAAGGTAKLVGLGATGQKLASASGAFGAYESARGFFNEGQGLSLQEGVKKGVEGSLMGLAFSIVGGGLRMAETPLLEYAEKLGGLRSFAIKSGTGAVSAAVEGTAVATAASLIGKELGEERSALPTKEELAASIGTVGLIRGGGAVYRGGAQLVKKAAERTPMELEEMKALGERAGSIENKTEDIKSLREGIKESKSYIAETKEKADTALAEEIAATRERRALEQQGASQEAVGELKETESVLSEKRMALDEEYKKSAGELADRKKRLSLAKRELRELQDQEPEPFQRDFEVTPDEIKDVQKKSTVVLSDEGARQLVIKRKRIAAIEKARRESVTKLPVVERIRRTVGAVLRKGGEMLDTYAPLERTHKNAAKISGEPEPELGANSAFTARQRDRGGKTQARQKELVDSLDSQQKKDNNFVEKLDNYLEAKKNQDMLPGIIADLEAKNKKGDLSGLIARKKAQLEEANAIAREAETNQASVVGEAQKHWDYAQEELDRLHEVGRIDDAKYAELKKNKHYIHSEAELENQSDPFSVIEHDELNQQTGLSGAFKRYGAYEGTRDNLIVSNLAQGKKIDFFSDTQKAIKQWVKDGIKTGEATPATGFDSLKPGQYPTGYNPNKQVFFWDKGVAKVYDVPNKVAKAFNYVRKEENVILRSLRLTNNLFKMGTTGISTGFAAMNLIRDMQNVVGGSRSAPFFQPSFVKTAAKMYGPTESGLTSGEKGLKKIIDQHLGSEFSLADTELQINRDQMNRVNDMLTAQKKANKEGSFVGGVVALLDKVASVAKQPAEKTLQGISKTLSFLGNWSEKIGRATVFQTELRRRAGSESVFRYWMENPEKNIPQKDIKEAAKEMTEVTLDFRRKMSPVIEDLNRYTWPYLKPSLLGAERLNKILSDPEIGPVAWRWISNVSALQGILRARMTEEERKKYQSQVNPEIAAKNLTIVKPDGVVMTIPAGQEFAGLYQLGAAGAEWLYNKISGKEQRERVFDEVLAAVKQLGENAIPGGYFIEPSNIVPSPIGKMILEENINRDIYSATDIESQAMLRLPKEDRFSPSTPKVYRLMSKYLRIGNVQSSPKMWEHRAKKLGSSFAEEMADVGDALLDFMGIGEEEWGLPKRAEESSIIGRFFNKDYTAYARNVQDYDKEMKDLEQKYNAFRRDPEKNKDFNRAAALYKQLKKKDATRIELISTNQKMMAALRREGHKQWQRYLDGEITKEQFRRAKEMEVARVAGKYYENQKKISDVTDKLLSVLREQKKKHNIK
jgi:hypothetical protein